MKENQTTEAKVSRFLATKTQIIILTHRRDHQINLIDKHGQID